MTPRTEAPEVTALLAQARQEYAIGGIDGARSTLKRLFDAYDCTTGEPEVGALTLALCRAIWPVLHPETKWDGWACWPLAGALRTAIEATLLERAARPEAGDVAAARKHVENGIGEAVADMHARLDAYARAVGAAEREAERERWMAYLDSAMDALLAAQEFVRDSNDVAPSLRERLTTLLTIGPALNAWQALHRAALQPAPTPAPDEEAQ